MGAMKKTTGRLRGWAISLLLHAIVLAWLAHQAPAPRLEDTPQRRSMLVFVTVRPKPMPKPPPPVAAPKPAAAAATAPIRPPRAISRPAAASDAPPAIVVERPPSATSAEVSANAPAFDIDAARTAARAVAREEGGGAQGGAALKETREEKLGRSIEKARRRDCKTAYAGMSLLAVIPLAIDTVTDTGCKW
jgi:type IV secretory pathway VirB10-like protein